MTPDSIAKGMLDYLKSKDQLANLPEIIDELTRQGLELVDPDLATVISAVPLAPKQKKALAYGLKTIFGRPFKLKTKLDNSVVAGFKIQVNGRIIDLSFNRQLQQLSNELNYD